MKLFLTTLHCMQAGTACKCAEAQTASTKLGVQPQRSELHTPLGALRNLLFRIEFEGCDRVCLKVAIMTSCVKV